MGGFFGTDSEYLDAFGRVSEGKANSDDYDHTEKYAKQSGSMGDRARAALAKHPR